MAGMRCRVPFRLPERQVAEAGRHSEFPHRQSHIPNASFTSRMETFTSRVPISFPAMATHEGQLPFSPPAWQVAHSGRHSQLPDASVRYRWSLLLPGCGRSEEHTFEL